MTVLVEKETQKGKRRVRVPNVAGFAFVKARGIMGAIADIGKARPPSRSDMREASGVDVALLGVDQEVRVETKKKGCIFFRRRSG